MPIRVRGARLLLIALAILFVVCVVVAVMSWQFDWDSLLLYGSAALGMTLVIALVVWKVPQWQAVQWKHLRSEARKIELEDKARGTIVSLVSGLGLVAAAAITLYQINDASISTQEQINDERIAANQTANLTLRGQLDERFVRALDNIGAPRKEIRVGGIYLLEQFVTSEPIGDTREEDAAEVRERKMAAEVRENTVTDVLTAYIRENSPAAPARPENASAGSAKPKNPPWGAARLPPIFTAFDRKLLRHNQFVGKGLRCGRLVSPRSDIQAALDTLQRLTEGEENPSLDLSYSDLGGTDLHDLNLRHAHLEGAQLFAASLKNTDLRGAHLDNVKARYACFNDADLRSAYLVGTADFSHASFQRTKVDKVCVTASVKFKQIVPLRPSMTGTRTTSDKKFCKQKIERTP